MIGQEKLVHMFDNMIENNTLPRFIALTGSHGSGRKTLAKYIADKLHAPLYKPNDDKVNITYVRNIIEQAYAQTNTIVYLLPDVDYFNKSAANALLKITEEPPNNAYFILTCCDGRSIPTTIRSRCVHYRLQTYSVGLIKEFAESLGIDTSTKSLSYCNTPGDVIALAKSGDEYKNLEEFTEKVINNVGKVSGANVFKIDETIAFKEDDTNGYNLNAFWTMFANLCMQRAKDIKNSKRNMYFKFIRITCEYREKLTLIGINKRNLFDLWLVEIRDTYNIYN